MSERKLVAWAVMTKQGKLGLFSGTCPIFWRRYIAQHEADRQGGKRHGFHVAKVLIEPIEGQG